MFVCLFLCLIKVMNGLFFLARYILRIFYSFNIHGLVCFSFTWELSFPFKSLPTQLGTIKSLPTQLGTIKSLPTQLGTFKPN